MKKEWIFILLTFLAGCVITTTKRAKTMKTLGYIEGWLAGYTNCANTKNWEISFSSITKTNGK